MSEANVRRSTRPMSVERCASTLDKMSLSYSAYSSLP
jgi:hypothetical protein